MKTPQSGQDFVRALKQPSETGSKLDLSRTVWKNQSFQLPNKAEIITEWLFSRFSKPADEITDCLAWDLLYEILHVSISSPWFPPLLQKFNIQKIVIHLLTLVISGSQNFSEETSNASFKTLAVLWDLTASRLSMENQLDCFSNFLQALAIGKHSPHISKLGLSISKSLRHVQKHSPNKKKNATLFIEKQYPAWLSALCRSDVKRDEALRTEIYSVGTEFIFALEYLRLDLTFPVTHPIFVTIQNLSPCEDTSHFLMLPSLFSSYISIIRSHKKTLFQSQESQQELQETGIRFLSSCFELMKGQDINPGVLWETRLKLLTTPEHHQLLHVSSQTLNALLKELLKEAVNKENFSNGYGDNVLPFVNVILRSRPEMVPSYLPPIFTWLFQVTTPSSAIQEFLQLSLEYYCKIRGLKGYTQCLFDSISIPEESPLLVASYITSSFFQVEHLNRLRRSIPSYLSASHVPQYIESIHQSLCNIFSTLTSDQDGHKHPRKRRRVDIHSEPSSPSITTFVLGCEISCHLLSTLPKLPDSIQNEAQSSLANVKKSVLSSLEGLLSEAQPMPHWKQIAIMALLRLNYSLAITGLIPSAPIINANHFDTLLSLPSSPNSTSPPWLSISLTEIFRTLLFNASHQYQDRLPNVIECLFEWVDFFIDNPHVDENQNVIPLLRMILQRWATLIDEKASQALVSHFINSLLRFSHNSDQLASEVMLGNVLRLASFWELPNIRQSLLTHLNEKTTVLEPTHKTLTKPQFLDAVNVYHFISFIPRDYLPKHTLSAMVQRLIAADTLWKSMSGNLDILLFVRTRLSNFLSSGALLELDEQSSVNLLKEIWMADNQVYTDHPPLLAVSLDVVKSLLNYWISGSHEKAGVKILRLFVDVLASTQLQAHVIQSLSMLGNIPGTIKLSTSSDIRHEFHELYTKAHEALKPLVKQYTEQQLRPSNEALYGWQTTLRLWKFLDLGSLPSELVFGPRLVQYCFASKDPKEGGLLVPAILSILIQESLLLPPASQSTHYSAILGLYVSFCEPQSLQDSILAQYSASLAVSEYSSILSLISNAVNDIPKTQFPSLIHLAAVVLNSHPQGSMKVMQTFFTKFLGQVVDRDLTSDPLHIVRILELVSSHCTEQPSSLRPVDLGSLWILIARVLAPSKVHDDQTSPLVFSEIIRIVGGLVRLRRDLVSSCLPQLGFTLRHLLSSLRRPRNSLGNKQLNMISAQLPHWINITDPLELEAAQSLARLLESLSLKTMIRGRSSSSSEDVKSESLTRPFSKHAAYVLQAYVDVVNDPICILPLDMRRALQPGLFSLCSMMGPHNRDSLMVSAFDVGGMAVMKTLWAEFEKQRYVGKE